MLHCHQAQTSRQETQRKPDSSNEYTAVKGRFKDGKLQMFLREGSEKKKKIILHGFGQIKE
jgi:hypothetical protein